MTLYCRSSLQAVPPLVARDEEPDLPGDRRREAGGEPLPGVRGEAGGEAAPRRGRPGRRGRSRPGIRRRSSCAGATAAARRPRSGPQRGPGPGARAPAHCARNGTARSRAGTKAEPPSEWRLRMAVERGPSGPSPRRQTAGCCVMSKSPARTKRLSQWRRATARQRETRNAVARRPRPARDAGAPPKARMQLPPKVLLPRAERLGNDLSAGSLAASGAPLWRTDSILSSSSTGLTSPSDSPPSRSSRATRTAMSEVAGPAPTPPSTASATARSRAPTGPPAGAGGRRFVGVLLLAALRRRDPPEPCRGGRRHASTRVLVQEHAPPPPAGR